MKGGPKAKVNSRDGTWLRLRNEGQEDQSEKQCDWRLPGVGRSSLVDVSWHSFLPSFSFFTSSPADMEMARPSSVYILTT